MNDTPLRKTPAAIWELCLHNLSAILDDDAVNILRATQLRGQNGQWQLVALNAMACKQIKRDYLTFVQSALKKLIPDLVKIEVVQEEPDLFERPKAGKGKPAKVFDSHLNADFSFDNFVAGPSNHQAFAAAQRVGSGALDFNPLIIYGGTGLGKSHLMHAIGNALKTLGNRQVLYITAESFVNDFIRHVRSGNMEDFASQYRNVDALLIDDVQFLGGKQTSQIEFFHTFNSLFDKKRQIIMTCDRFPKEIDGLEERLKSRFGSGLSVSVTPPEFETRLAILQNKAEHLDFDLPNDIAVFIATHVVSNVRELNGALTAVYARSMIHRKAPTLDEVRDTLKDHIKAQQQQIPVSDIQKTVARYYKIEYGDMLSKIRKADIAFPRQVAMALCSELTSLTPANIGSAFARDRTTVLHAVGVIADKKAVDSEFRKEYEGLKMMITG